ncbi:hypothetical protein KJ765_03860 [Candidatus Micrarchaeota archaeon]|nr:hypothetical protein [Candidatus Micrarchaeota archaeon]
MYVGSSIRKELNAAKKSFEEARDAFESLQETLEVLADKKLLKGIRSSEKDFSDGRFHSIVNLKV